MQDSIPGSAIARPPIICYTVTGDAISPRQDSTMALL